MLLKAKYILPISSEVIEDGAVFVREGRIVEVGKFVDLVVKYATATIHDFGLAAILPGFINSHSHLEFSTLRGLVSDLPYATWRLKIDEKADLLNEDDWHDSAFLGMLEAVRGGITTIADITPTGASLKAAHEVGLRAIIYRECGTLYRTEVDDDFKRATSDLEQWRDMVDPKRIHVGLAPSALFSCHPDMFKMIAQYANSTPNVPVSLHLAGSQEEYDFVKYGSPALFVPRQHKSQIISQKIAGRFAKKSKVTSKLASITTTHSNGATPTKTDVKAPTHDGFGYDSPPWLATGTSPVRYVLNWQILDCPNVLAVHCVHVDKGDLDILAEHDVSVALCSRCNAQLGMGLAPLDGFMRAGLRVGIGTDSPAAVEETDMFSEMRLGMLLQRATGIKQRFFSADKMLHLATLGSAQALKIDKEVGSLEAGKLADIIAVDLSNSNQVPTHDANSAIVHTTSPNDVLMTMVSGDIIYDGHHRHGIDVARVFARSDEIRAKLRQ